LPAPAYLDGGLTAVLPELHERIDAMLVGAGL
jgi:hypothetical protein